MADIERFNVKKLQEEVEYANLVLQRVGDMLDDEEVKWSKDDYVYQLHYLTSSIVGLMKPYMEQNFSFNDAFDLAYNDFKE